MYIFYFNIGPQRNLLLLDSQNYHKYLIPIFWWFLALLRGTLPSGNFLFEFRGISSNFREFWVIFLGSTPTVLQSDIGPSCLCLIPGSDRYNSVLFFELLNSWFTYAEGLFLCNFVLKSNQVYTKYSPRFLQAPFKWRFPIFHWRGSSFCCTELGPSSKKCDILGTKNEKKTEILWFSIFFKNTVLKANDIRVLKNSTLHHKISTLGGGGLLRRLSVKVSSDIHYTITQSHCW